MTKITKNPIMRTMAIDAKNFMAVPPIHISGTEINRSDSIRRVEEIGHAYHGTWERRTLPGFPKESVLVKELILPVDSIYVRLIQREDNLLRNVLNPKGIGPRCYGLITTDLPDGERRLSLVMEDIPGETLATLLTSLPLFKTWTQQRKQTFARAFGITLADELIKMQQQGLVHRDIKPENIMVNLQTGKPQVIDFGTTVSVQEYQNWDPNKPLEGELKGFGTPEYIAPEQAYWQDPYETVDTRTDLYALALVIAEIMADRTFAYDGKTSYDEFLVTRRYRSYLDQAGLNNLIPDDFRNVLYRAIDPDKTRRYQSALEFKQALQQVQIP